VAHVLRLEQVIAQDSVVDVDRSFDDFFGQEYERLLRAMYLVVGEREDAEDIVQEAFVRVLERWPAVQQMESPTGYLYRTAMNTFRSRYRRATMALRRIAMLTPRPRNLYEDVEVSADVRKALSALTPRQRAAIVLTELLGYGAEDASQLLDIQPSTVRALTTQARSRLRAALGAGDE